MGVDIEAKNARYMERRVTDDRPLADLQGGPFTADTYYPFPVSFVHADVAEMADHPDLTERRFDLLIYTSSIEHMNRPVGLSSLVNARNLANPNATLVLTTPNTPEDQDGYDTQYRAHVYEWSRSELIDGLTETWWTVLGEWGVEIRYKDLLAAATPQVAELIENLAGWVPKEFLTPVFAPMYPKAAREIGFVCMPTPITLAATDGR